jgi:hypothetical protein
MFTEDAMKLINDNISIKLCSSDLIQMEHIINKIINISYSEGYNRANLDSIKKIHETTSKIMGWETNSSLVKKG